MKMHADIIPHLTNPHLLTDFLSATLDAGGLNGMLALHGIFTLVTKHGLEYPNFYRRLYTLLTPAALMVGVISGQRCILVWSLVIKEIGLVSPCWVKISGLIHLDPHIGDLE